MSAADRRDWPGDINNRISVADNLFAARDRLLENTGFQRLSSSFPFTRGIARREAQALFDLCAGFVYSQILFACVSLGLFDHLKDKPRTLAELARRMSLPLAAAERLLRGAIALRLVSRRSGGRYGLSMLGAALNGNPSVAAMIRHHAMLYRDLQDPVALLRGESHTEMSRFWAYAKAGAGEADSDDVAEYSRLMTESQALVAHDILDAISLKRHRCLLDIGGGEGAFITAAAKRYPSLRFQILDLPAVAVRTERTMAQGDLADRCEIHAGSFLEGELPRGADVISLVRVLHDHDDPVVLNLLRAIHAALPPGGVLLIAEPFAETPGAERMGDAYFGFYLLAMGQGRPRAAAELRSMLLETGFVRVRQLRTRRPMLTGAITASRD